MCPTCESANRVSCDECGGSWPVKKFGPKLMLCDICIKKQIDIAVMQAKERDQAIRTSGDYFVSKTIPICEIKELIDLSEIANGNFELHRFVRERFEHFASVLFTKSDEMSSAQSNQQLVIEFRAQVRNQIKAGDINYTPKEKAPKVRVPKLAGANSKRDKAQSIFEKMAQKLMVAETKRGNQMTFQQALEKIESDFS